MKKNSKSQQAATSRPTGIHRLIAGLDHEVSVHGVRPALHFLCRGCGRGAR